MSAFGIATNRSELTVVGSVPLGPPSIGDQVLTAVGALVKWIPAEIVAAYAATVLALQPPADSELPANLSLPAWLICLIATPILIGLLAWRTGNTTKLWYRVGFSIPAFALWSASIPASAWNLIPAFQAQTPLALLLLLLATVGFTIVAEKLTT